MLSHTPINNNFFFFFNLLQSYETHECKPTWLSETGDLRACPLGSTTKIVALDMYTSSSKRNADALVLSLKHLREKVGEVPIGLFGL